jgi:hypothetical protein
VLPAKFTHTILIFYGQRQRLVDLAIGQLTAGTVTRSEDACAPAKLDALLGHAYLLKSTVIGDEDEDAVLEAFDNAVEALLRAHKQDPGEWTTCDTVGGVDVSVGCVLMHTPNPSYHRKGCRHSHARSHCRHTSSSDR